MKQEGIPVLMYHSLAGEENGINSGRNVSVSAAAFKQQMEWLHREGYKTIDSDTLQQYIDSGSLPDGKYIQLTFDDGYRSWHLHAKDILASYGFTATMFLSTAYVDGAYEQEDFQFVRNDRPLTWREVRELAASGWSVQAHGHHHYRWTSMPIGNLVREMDKCRNEIEQQTGTAVDTVAYPYGDYSTEILRYFSDSGFTAAYTVHTGKLAPATDKLRLPRIEINNTDTLDTFRKKVETGYTSPSQALRAKMRDLVYANTRLKDIIQMVVS